MLTAAGESNCPHVYLLYLLCAAVAVMLLSCPAPAAAPASH